MPNNFFSLGQSEDYYATLARYPSVLENLRDCAKNLSIFEENKNESVMNVSLLREIYVERVKNRFSLLATGESVRQTDFLFKYCYPQKDSNVLKLDFKIVPDSIPPTNIHAIIGRNGVGKTYLFHNIIKTVLEPLNADYGKTESDNDPNLFSKLVFISFSIFDSKKLNKGGTKGQTQISYHHIGNLLENHLNNKICSITKEIFSRTEEKQISF